MHDEPLFQATFRGVSVEVGHATLDELSGLTAEVPEKALTDILTLWSIVALRYATGRPTELHALGWRVKLRNVWITSPLVAAKATPGGQVSTYSGNVYALDETDTHPLALRNRVHLADVLGIWGFTDVA